MRRLRTSFWLLLSTFRVAGRRLLANRRLAAGLLAGFIVAVAAASSVPAFASAALQRMLQADLTAAAVENPMPAAFQLIHIANPKRPTKPEWFPKADRIARQEGLRLIGVPVDPFVRLGSLDVSLAEPVDLAKANGDIERWMYLGFLSDLEDHIRIIDGQAPKPGKTGDVYEVLVEEEVLDKQDLTVGMEFYLPVNREEDAPRIQLKVAGAFVRKDQTDPYWTTTVAYDQHFWLSEETFTQSILAEPEVLVGQFYWYYGVPSSAVRITDVIDLLGGMYELEARVAQVVPDTTLFRGPMSLLTSYAVKANGLQMLLLLLAVPPLAVVGYFLLVTSGKMVESQRQEIAVLRSRGASLWQVVGIHVLEGTLLAALALVGGYPLGMFLARAMASTSGFLQFVDRVLPPLMLPADFWIYGLGAAVLAVVAYVGPVIPAARQSIVSYKQESARLLRGPLWARWGFDLLCIALAGYAHYTLTQRHAAELAAAARAVGKATAQAGADTAMMEPLHVLAPALFVIGFGLLLLRLVPLVASLVARLATRRAGAPVYLALTQLARAPGTYMPVILLLTLTVGTGLYSAAAARTLDRNTTDRVSYAGGADVVLDEVWQYLEEPDEKGALQVVEIQAPPWNEHHTLPQVAHPARVRMQDVIPVIAGKSQKKGRLMAIDPVDFGQVAWFRGDLNDAHINNYLNLLASDEEAVLVSTDFLARGKLKVGDRITLTTQQDNQEISLVIYGTVEYWPSLYPREADPFITNLDYIESNLGLYPYQVWLKMQPGARLNDLVESLRERGISVLRADDFRQKLIKARRDPQLSGLLGGLTSGFLLSAGITIMGFLLYAALSARSRTVQFGVLRAMGLSTGQLLWGVALEQLLSVALGVTAGTGLGLYAARLFVPFLQQGSDAASRTPPFVIIADPADRVRLYVVLTLMLVFGFVGLVLALGRLRVAEALKLGEDS